MARAEHHTPSHSPSHDLVRRHRRRLILILGALTAFGAMAIDLYLPAFPLIANDLNTDIGSVELTVSFFVLGLGLGQLVYGPISDRFGRRTPLIVGSAMYAIAAIGCTWAHSIKALIILRVLMALGGSAGSVVARAVVRDLFSAKESAHLFSILMLVMGVVPILAPMVGGQLVGWLGWRGLFGIMTAFGVFCLLAVSWGLPETLPSSRRTQTGVSGVFKNYIRLLRDLRFIKLSTACGLTSGMIFAYVTGISSVLMGQHGISARVFGLFFGVNAVGLIMGSQYNRLLLRSHEPRAILRVALTVLAIAALLLAAHGITDWGGLPALSVLLFVILSSLGTVFPNATMLVLEPFAEMAGSASALLGTAQYVFGFITGGLVSLFHNGSAIPMAVIMAACAVPAWFLVGRKSA